MKQFYVVFSLALAACLNIQAAWGAELPMKPGLWKSTTTRTSSMQAAATTDTSTDCIKETTFDPKMMMTEMQDCKFVENKLENKHTLKFKMICAMQGAESSVQGTYFIKGDNGNGNMSMQMNMGSMTMSMDIKWDSKRIGDC